MKQLLLKLADTLSSLFFPRTGKRTMVNHLSLIALSLVLAYFIWLIAMFTVMTIQAINIPILITNSPPNASVRIESPASQNINVMVNIPKNLVPTVSPSNFIFQLDLADVSSQITSLETVQEYPISPLDVKVINLPGLISVTEVTPRTVRIRINYHHKEVPVKINVDGEPLPGFYLDEEELSSIPSELTVVAPQRVLQELEYIETYPVNIAGRSSSFTQNVALNVPSNVEIYDRSPQVEVFLPVEEEIEEIEITDVPVRLERITDEFVTTVEPSEVTVTLEGPQSLVPQISAGDISLMVLVPAEEGTFGKELQPVLRETLPSRLRDEISIVDTDPRSVVVRNEPEEEEEIEEEEEDDEEEEDNENASLPEDDIN